MGTVCSEESHDLLEETLCSSEELEQGHMLEREMGGAKVLLVRSAGEGTLLELVIRWQNCLLGTVDGFSNTLSALLLQHQKFSDVVADTPWQYF
jgi:hypothetical protein